MTAVAIKSAASEPSPLHADARPRFSLGTLQLGMGWFPEQPGGLDRYYFELCRALEQLGVDVRGLVTGSGNAELQSGGRIRTFAASDASMVQRWRGLRAGLSATLAELTKPTIVAAHFALYAFPAMQKLRRLPFVVHFHGPWADESRREGTPRAAVALKAAIERRVYRSADRIIVLSQAFNEILCDRYGVDPDRVRVIPGGVDVDRFNVSASRSEARAKLAWPTDRPILFCVRRLVNRMGLHALIHAVRRLKARHNDVLCFIGGRGPLADELDALVKTEGLTDHVRLLGFVPDSDLPVAYRAADMSVVPSESWEGFGLITIESLAAGTPVVVTSVGGLPEVVRPLSDELVTAAASCDGLFERLDHFLTHPGQLPTSDACRDYAASHFAWDAIASRVAGAYREVL